MRGKLHCIYFCILGDPGADSRQNVIFRVSRYLRAKVGIKSERRASRRQAAPGSACVAGRRKGGQGCHAGYPWVSDDGFSVESAIGLKLFLIILSVHFPEALIAPIVSRPSMF